MRLSAKQTSQHQAGRLILNSVPSSCLCGQTIVLEGLRVRTTLKLIVDIGGLVGDEAERP